MSNSNFDYINLGIATIALLSSIFSHMKSSKCCHGMIDIQMKSKTPSLSQLEKQETINEKSLLINHSSPIPIPKIPENKRVFL